MSFPAVQHQPHHMRIAGPPPGQPPASAPFSPQDTMRFAQAMLPEGQRLQSPQQVGQLLGEVAQRLGIQVPPGTSPMQAIDQHLRQMGGPGLRGLDGKLDLAAARDSFAKAMGADNPGHPLHAESFSNLVKSLMQQVAPGAQRPGAPAANPAQPGLRGPGQPGAAEPQAPRDRMGGPGPSQPRGPVPSGPQQPGVSTRPSRRRAPVQPRQPAERPAAERPGVEQHTANQAVMRAFQTVPADQRSPQTLGTALERGYAATPPAGRQHFGEAARRLFGANYSQLPETTRQILEGHARTAAPD